MFSNSFPASPSVEEGTVVQVDPIRFLCKVRTLTGQVLNSVQWLLPSGGSTRAADRFTPMVGDRVMLNFGLGYAVIIGFLPKFQLGDGATPLKIESGSILVDTGNYSPEGSATVGDQNKPRDMVHGDRLLSSVGGAFLGLLRGGAALLRAGRGAEVFMSNFKSLVRVVSRNWEHFTDVSSDVVKNFKGKVYRYVGYAPTFDQSKVEDYRLHFYYGDAKAAETIKTEYLDNATVPTTDQVIYKEQITDLIEGATVRELMRRTIELNGNEEVWITNGANFTRVKSTAEELRLTWNDENVVILNGTKIHAYHKDGADVIMDAAGIRASFSDGDINMSSGSVVTSFGNTSATLTNASGTITNGGGTAFVSSSQTSISNNGHSVVVTAGGVAIS